jgi:curved DNA binding protein
VAPLAEGDLVKIDMGCHLDGYAATVAHSLVVGASAEAPITDRRADVMAAAQAATQAVLRLMKPGTRTSQLTAVVEQTAAQFGCHAIEGVYSHEVRRFVLEGEACFPGCRAEAGSPLAVEEAKREDYELQVNQVWSVDVVLSTGSGKTVAVDARTTVFRRVPDRSYMLRLKASRAMLAEISARFPDFPFSLRAFESEGAARLGLTELLSHQLVEAYPVMSERAGEFVAHLKFTAMLTPAGLVKITGTNVDAAVVRSSKAVTDPKLLELLSAPVPSAKSAKSRRKKLVAAAKAADAAGGAAAAADDVPDLVQ